MTKDSPVVLQNFINGEFCDSKAHLESQEPATGKTWALVPDSDSTIVDDAVDAAHHAFPSWAKTPMVKRAELMLKLADALEADIDNLANLESRDQGKPFWLAKNLEMPRAIGHFRHFAQVIPHKLEKLLSQEEVNAISWTMREPIGVCGIIAPWNFPLYEMSSKLAPALIAGNTVVCKPSELTSVTAHRLCQLIQQVGFPKGVVNMVYGTGPKVGEPIVAHKQVTAISFTGSTATGKRVSTVAAPMIKRLMLEMGGKNAAIVFEDADIKSTDHQSVMQTFIRACFVNQGEVCVSMSRIYVQESIFQEFLETFTTMANKLTVGPNQGDYIGPLVSKVHWEKVNGYVELAKAEGGTIHCGHGIRQLNIPEENKNGYFMAPTIITGLKQTSRCVQEEIFGPVVIVIPFHDEEEAVEKANHVAYGLCASVFSKDISRCSRVAKYIRAGTVWINSWLVRCYDMPHGGMKASGLGREGIHESYEFFTEVKTVCLKY